MPVSTFLLLLALPWMPQEAPGDVPGEVWEDQVQTLNSIHIPKGVSAGEAVCFLCSIRVDGELTDEAVAILGNITVSGTVSSEVVAVGGNISLLPGSQTGDEVVAVAGTIRRSPEAAVTGAVEEIAYLYFPGQRSLPWPGVAIFAATSLVLLLLSGLPLSQARLRSMQTGLKQRPGATLLLGIGALFLLAVLGVLSSWLGPAEDWADLLLFTLAMVLAWLGTAALVRNLGERLGQSRDPAAAAVGSVLLVLLSAIPVLGLVIWLVVPVMGLGITLLSGLGSDPDWLLNRFRRRGDPLTSSP